jgi:hypothetical protein
VKDLKKWELSDEETRRFKSSGVELLPMEINWTAGSNDQTIGAFADWIRHNRPKQFPPPRSDASRKNVMAAFLTRIAGMRLLHHYSHYDGLYLAQSHGLKFPKQQSNAVSTRQAVRRDVPLLFQSRAFQAITGRALIPSTEYPRSWNTFFQSRDPVPRVPYD